MMRRLRRMTAARIVAALTAGSVLACQGGKPPAGAAVEAEGGSPGPARRRECQERVTRRTPGTRSKPVSKLAISSTPLFSMTAA